MGSVERLSVEMVTINSSWQILPFQYWRCLHC